MDSIEDVEIFTNQNETILSSLPEGFVYESSADKYKKNAGPVENLDTIAKFVFIISVFATFIILGLVIIFFMGDRKKEIGVYLSVGERKKNVIRQFLVEVLLVSTLAISCASISGLFLGDKLSNYMLDVQRYVQREQALGDIAKYTPIYTPVKNGISLQTRDDVINNYEVKANVEYFMIIFVVGELSIIISSVLPMVYLSSFKPKEIML